MGKLAWLGSDIAVAYDILEIDVEKFNRIHTSEIKNRFLIYKRILAELKYRDPKDREIIARAYGVIDQKIQKKQSIYGPHSVGLWDIDRRTSSPSPAEALVGQPVEQSLILVKKKESGVEPGFIGVMKEDLLVHFYENFKNENDRYDFIDQLPKEGDPVEILQEIYQDHLPLYMVKLTYNVGE